MDNTQRLYRSSRDHNLAGVCGGIAEYLNVDPTLVRAAFVVLTILSAGTGVMLYGALWLIVPDEPSEKRKRKNEEL
jgi:phage shock protein C